MVECPLPVSVSLDLLKIKEGSDVSIIELNSYQSNVECNRAFLGGNLL